MTQNTFSDTSLAGADFLEHYGVKGMKWGKRKDKDAPKGGSKSGTKTASKSKYGTYTTNADGSREIYVGGVGSAGKHLSEEEQAEADELAPEVEKLKRETNSAYDEVNAIVREIQESPGNQKRFPTLQETNALTALGKKRAEAQKRADELGNQYSTKHSRLMKLQTKARAAENQYYKDNPGERRKAVTMPEPGKTTYTSKADNFQGDQTRFKKRVKHDDLSSMGSSAISTLLSEEDTLTHYGVKGMKWGVRKDGKPQGYQGPSKSKRTAKKVKKAVSDAVDPDKRAKRKKARAKAKFERQRVLEEASAYEKATAESKKNTRENQDTSSTTSTRTNTPPARSEKPKRHGYSPASALSDEELSALNKRFEMEKKYSTFVEERRPKSTTEKVGKFLRKAGTEAASNVTKQLMTKALGAAVTKSTDNLLKSAGAGQPKPKQTPKPQEKPTPKPQESPTPKSTPTPKPNTGPIQGPRNVGPLQGPRNVGPLQGPRNTGPLQGPRNTGPRTGPVEARRTAPPAIPTTRAPLEPVSNPRNTRVIETTPSLQSILNKSYSETKASGPSLAGKSWIDELNWDERRRRR